MKKHTSKYEITAYICIAIGILCLLIFAGKVCSSGYSLFKGLNGETIELNAHIGAFIGGVVGPFFALAGFFIYYSALKLQGVEITESKRLSSKQQFEEYFFNLLKSQRELKFEQQGDFTDIRLNNTSYIKTREREVAGNFFRRVVNELRILYVIFKRKEYNGWEENEIDRWWEEHWTGVEFREVSPESDEINTKALKDLLEHTKLSYLTDVYNIKKETVEKTQIKDDELLRCQCIYAYLYHRYSDTLGAYCRHLYNLVKYVDEEYQRTIKECESRKDLSAIEKKKEKEAIEVRFKSYISFIQAILSTSELCVLFYNSLIFEKAQKLYVKYDLFENLWKEKLIKKEHHLLIKNAKMKSNGELFDIILKELQQ